MKSLIISIIFIIVAAIIVAWSGIYNVSAKDPHFAVTSAFLDLVREQSIEARSEDIKAPDLKDQNMVRAGAELYNEMCTGCHLAPGMEATELHQGLNPAPPIFHEEDLSKDEPSELFWVIKNGIKMTGMPAWSPSHTDNQIWDMVAFIRELNDMSAERYISLTGISAEAMNHEHSETGHSHSH